MTNTSKNRDKFRRELRRVNFENGEDELINKEFCLVTSAFSKERSFEKILTKYSAKLFVN